MPSPPLTLPPLPPPPIAPHMPPSAPRLAPRMPPRWEGFYRVASPPPGRPSRFLNGGCVDFFLRLTETDRLRPPFKGECHPALSLPSPNPAHTNPLPIERHFRANFPALPLALSTTLCSAVAKTCQALARRQPVDNYFLIGFEPLPTQYSFPSLSLFVILFPPATLFLP